MATSSSWTPAPGRHEVSVGRSLGRALKARRGASASTSKLPEKDFYSMRYNFKPSSVDVTKSATLVKDANSKLVVEHQSTQEDEVHVFLGEEVPAKEWLCVLIYDEENGTFTLEKLDSTIALNLDRKASGVRPSHKTSPPTTGPSTGTRPEPEEVEEDVEMEEAQVPAVEEPPPPPPRAAPKTKPPPAAVQKASVRNNLALPTASKPKRKRDPEPYSDAEVLEFGKRTPPASQLELPGSSSTYAQPLPAPSKPVPARVQAAPITVDSDSEEEEWDEVPAIPPPNVAQMETEGEETGDDFAEFENLVNAELGANEEEDFLAGELFEASPEPEPESPKLAPMSLRQLAGEDISDDEYSSSEESEED
ncbi:RNA polymerase II transcription elongation factor-domain-containing protein [Mycena floridula]|nr:RNA polymerase II transcription elongation factor-domain-containing protein [Mycena floridula]